MKTTASLLGAALVLTVSAATLSTAAIAQDKRFLMPGFPSKPIRVMTTVTAGGGLDIIVSALEPNGDLRWAKRYGAVGDQTSPIVAVGPKGQIAVGCTATGTIDFGTGNLTSAGTDVVLAEIGPN